MLSTDVHLVLLAPRRFQAYAGGRLRPGRVCSPSARNLLLLLLLLELIYPSIAVSYLSIDEMVAAGEQSYSSLENLANSTERFTVAANEISMEDHGAYGEFPVQAMASILHHPAVRATVEKGANFVDIGSGAGRLVLAVASMHSWTSVVGIEAGQMLDAMAKKAILDANRRNILRSGDTRSLHSSTAELHQDPAAKVLAQADVAFVYSTALPSEDGLRLPRFSASLASVMREGSLVITTDKWLVGERFEFQELMTVVGEHDDPAQVHIWRVIGQRPAEGFDAVLAGIEANWMGEDACADNERACEALLRVIEDVETQEGEL